MKKRPAVPSRDMAVVIMAAVALALPAAADQTASSTGLLYKSIPGGHMTPADRGYFRIFNLEDGAVLDLRSAPSPTAPILKQLRSGEIVASAGISHWGGDISWREVTSDHRDGWIPQRHLKRARLRLIAGTSLPVAGLCRGYEPPWALSWSEQQVQLALFPGRETLNVRTAVAAGDTRAALLTAASAGRVVELVSTGESCSLAAGTSPVGTSGYVIVTGQDGKRLRAGCCEATEAAFEK